jgi:hypothetical protein
VTHRKGRKGVAEGGRPEAREGKGGRLEKEAE